MNTVLLIHHSRRLRRQLRLILARRYEVTAAHGAGAVERLLRHSKPDVVLLDHVGTAELPTNCWRAGDLSMFGYPWSRSQGLKLRAVRWPPGATARVWSCGGPAR